MPDDSTREADDAILEAWCGELVKRLYVDEAQVDIHAVLGLAGKIAHAVVRPAAPLTAYVVGYAAGRAAARDGVSGAEAFAAASVIARELAQEGGFGPTE
jgi:hypothetical protein